jgi:hypothetical protein
MALETKNKSILDSFEKLIKTHGNCKIPTYFINDENIITSCSNQLGLNIFKISLGCNFIVSCIIISSIPNKKIFIIIFIIFHIILYTFVKKIINLIYLNEWVTYNSYKKIMDADTSVYDSPLRKFEAINAYVNAKVINKRNLTYFVFFISFMFAWVPFIFRKHSFFQHNKYIKSVSKAV